MVKKGWKLKKVIVFDECLFQELSSFLLLGYQGKEKIIAKCYISVNTLEVATQPVDA